MAGHELSAFAISLCQHNALEPSKMDIIPSIPTNRVRFGQWCDPGPAALAERINSIDAKAQQLAICISPERKR